jgi:hypothetical protein
VKFKQEFMGLSRNIMSDIMPSILSLGRGAEHLMELFSSSKEWALTFAAALAIIAVAIAPITSGMVALLLVIEDLYVYFKGGNSLFGEVMNGIKEMSNDPKKHPVLSANKTIGNFIDKSLGLPMDMLGGLLSSGLPYGYFGKSSLDNVHINHNININDNQARIDTTIKQKDITKTYTVVKSTGH